MAFRKQLLAMFFAVAVVAPLVAVPEPTVDENAYNVAKLKVLRDYPERFAQIRRAAEELHSLSPERQANLRRIDHDLHQEPAATQARLHDLLDVYDDWLSRLGEADRDRIRKAPDKTARLAVIRELRRDDWLRTQPKSLREKFAALPVEERELFVAKARGEERARRAEWADARRFWDDLGRNKPLPKKLLDFEPAVQTYVNDVLMKLLSKEERDRLAKAEGQWPLYAQTLVELADAHPPALSKTIGPSVFLDLPKSVRDSFGKKGGGILKEKNIEKKLKPFEGQFPNFAMKLANFAKENGAVMPFEWWAYNFKSLSLPMQEFVTKQLMTRLGDKEKRMIVEDEGKWPEYPETIRRLAKTHNLVAPWFTLPGARERWDAYRAVKPPLVQGFPELPKYKLRDFVYFDLDNDNRALFKNVVERSQVKGDAAAWAYLFELYFKRYPSELTRLRR